VRPPLDFVVYGFASTHDALAAEALLEDAGVSATPVPAPRTLGARCGIALRVPREESERAEGCFSAAGMEWSGRTGVQDV
jgi:hypothetical protein